MRGWKSWKRKQWKNKFSLPWSVFMSDGAHITTTGQLTSINTAVSHLSYCAAVQSADAAAVSRVPGGGYFGEASPP
jgi:hypothetical protein